VFRSFRMELITKYTVSLVTAPRLLPSLCSRSRRFWMHRRNWRCGIACRTASCFSWSSGALWKRRLRRQEQIYTEPNRMSKQGGRPQRCSYRPELPLFLQMYGQPSEELEGPPRVPSHPLEWADTFRTWELICQRYPKWYFIGLRLIFFVNTLHCATCGETIRTLTIFGEVHSRLDREIYTEKRVFRMALSSNAGLSIWCVSSIVFRGVKANLNENTLFLQIDRKSRIALKPHICKYPSRKCCDCKIH